MLRGEIWQVDLDPARGGAANMRRPAVIVSNDRANAAAIRLDRGVVPVVPVTSNTEKVPIPGVVAGSERWPGRRFEGAGPAGWIRRCATSPLPS
ncbi:type II toxin-antitoxin system PemK/MazF family toxin [Mycobacterium tuberculosis]|nr:type II toxin-antitoxin system PemK/MazF family toxin [Mycobacterium tuberculosis]REA18578.1 type II toxin-antitoxin system PemK/MazF family toxin [Mycobacterium tuberculosis]